MKTNETIHFMQKQYSDSELLDMCRSGNVADKNKAFGILVKKFSRSLYYYLRKILVNHDDTDDVLQETFIKAWSSLDSLKDASAIQSWLFRIASNNAMSFLREKSAKACIPLDDYDVIDADTSNYVEKTDAMSALTMQAIHRLPKTQQMVFSMKYFQGMKYSEISIALGTSEGSLKASYHIAVEKIKQFVTEKTEH